VRNPLAIDLFCGLGGWTSGLLAESYDVVGFDIERHAYGEHRYPAQLVVQDALTLHGSQFKDATLIVASPPCQEFSYMAMPWKRAKQIAKALRGEGEFPDGYTGSRTVAELTRLFDACFRIQREASKAAGHHIPMVVENVRGAEAWLGKAAWHYGSFYLWGDVPALMPMAFRGVKVGGIDFNDFKNGKGTSPAFSDAAVRAIKNSGGSWFAIGLPGQKVTGQNPVTALSVGHGLPQSDESGRKIGGDWFSDPNSTCRKHGSKSSARKMASAMIAKIPLPLSRHIAYTYHD